MIGAGGLFLARRVAHTFEMDIVTDLETEHARYTEMTSAAADLANRAKKIVELNYPIAHATAFDRLCAELQLRYGVPASLVARAGGQLPTAPAQSAPAPAPATGRDANKPSGARQNAILAAIRATGEPLIGKQIQIAMRLRSVGKLRHHLAWMVEHGVLVRRGAEGYWPACDPR